MNINDVAELKSILAEFFDERETHEHREEHEWIRAKIDAEKEKKIMYSSIARSAIGWSIPFLLTGLIVWAQTGHWPSP